MFEMSIFRLYFTYFDGVNRGWYVVEKSVDSVNK